jgi:3-isopropylmalate/(R)-2-methylmalate dehydratase small subunit
VVADPTPEINIDVASRTLAAPAIGLEVTFPLDDATRHRFLEGLDDIGITLGVEQHIAAHEAQRPAHKPRMTPGTAT